MKLCWMGNLLPRAEQVEMRLLEGTASPRPTSCEPEDPRPLDTGGVALPTEGRGWRENKGVLKVWGELEQDSRTDAV